MSQKKAKLEEGEKKKSKKMDVFGKFLDFRK